MKLSEEIQGWIIDEETAYFPGTETMRGWADKATLMEAAVEAAENILMGENTWEELMIALKEYQR